MRIAALVFSISGIAYLGWGLTHSPTGLGFAFLVAFTSALLYQSYALFRFKKSARVGAMISSLFIVIACVSIVCMLVMSAGTLTAIPAEAWRVFTVIGLVCFANVIAFVALAIATPPPNSPAQSGPTASGRPPELER